MKKLFLFSVVATLLIIGCSKIDKQSNNEVVQADLMRSNEDPIVAEFSEDEYNMSEEKANSLGFSSIKVKAGNYTIRKDKTSGKFYTLLNVAELGDPITSDIPVLEAGVRIVKRSQCRHFKSCHCPLGFRCGWTDAPAGGLEEPGGGSSGISTALQEYDATSKINPSTNQLEIVFKNVTDSKIFQEQE